MDQQDVGNGIKRKSIFFELLGVRAEFEKTSSGVQFLIEPVNSCMFGKGLTEFLCLVEPVHSCMLLVSI
jgi:hypothetical protein